MKLSNSVAAGDGRRVLLLFLVVAASLWMFALIAGAIVDGGSMQFDRTLLLSLRSVDELSDPIGPAWFEESVRDITALGGTTLLTLLVIIVAGFLLLVGRPRTVVFLLFAVIGGSLLGLLLKDLFDRPRPDLFVPGQRVYTASFPSGHSMNSAVVYLTLASIVATCVRRRTLKVFVMLVAVLITMLVGASRVYLGVHWPTDVLAGWSAGAAWAVFCWLSMHAMQARHLLEAELKGNGGDG